MLPWPALPQHPAQTEKQRLAGTLRSPQSLFDRLVVVVIGVESLPPLRKYHSHRARDALR